MLEKLANELGSPQGNLIYKEGNRNINVSLLALFRPSAVYMVGAAQSLQSNSSRDVLSSKLFSFKCFLRPLQLLELFSAVKSQLFINKAGSVEFSVSPFRRIFFLIAYFDLDFDRFLGSSCP